MRQCGDVARERRRYPSPSSGRRSAASPRVVFMSRGQKTRDIVVGPQFNLVESVVREYLRDHAGTVYCSLCLSGALAGTASDGVISTVMMELTERQPPFSSGRCSCGSEGLSYSLP